MRNALRPRAIRRLPRLLSLFLSRFTDARSLPYPLGLFLHPPCSCVSVRTRGTRRFFLSFAAARANSWHRRSPLRMIHRSRAAITAHASFHHLFSLHFSQTFNFLAISPCFILSNRFLAVGSRRFAYWNNARSQELYLRDYEQTANSYEFVTSANVQRRILVGSNRLFRMNASLQQRKHIGWNEDEIATYVSLATANRFRYQPVNWIVSCLEICIIANHFAIMRKKARPLDINPLSAVGAYRCLAKAIGVD